MSNYQIPEKARVAVLTGAKKIEIFELPVPEIGDDEVLVKVEQTGICGTDVHEYKGDPFGYIPVELGPRVQVPSLSSVRTLLPTSTASPSLSATRSLPVLSPAAFATPARMIPKTSTSAPAERSSVSCPVRLLTRTSTAGSVST